MEEKFFVNRYEDWLNVFRCKKRANQRYGSRCRCRAQVRGLTNLTSRLVLSLGVGVLQRLGSEKDGQGRQGENNHPYPITSRLVPVATHRRPTLPQSYFGRQRVCQVSNAIQLEKRALSLSFPRCLDRPQKVAGKIKKFG